MSDLVERLRERGFWSDGGKVWDQDALCAAAATALEAKDKELAALRIELEESKRGADRMWSGWTDAEKRYREATARAEAAERERAEAQFGFENELKIKQELAGALRDAQRERDEARAEAKRLNYWNNQP